jgi:hypothetical protein
MYIIRAGKCERGRTARRRKRTHARRGPLSVAAGHIGPHDGSSSAATVPSGQYCPRSIWQWSTGRLNLPTTRASATPPRAIGLAARWWVRAYHSSSTSATPRPVPTSKPARSFSFIFGFGLFFLFFLWFF